MTMALHDKDDEQHRQQPKKIKTLHSSGTSKDPQLLPPDIIIEILSRLPVKSLLRIRQIWGTEQEELWAQKQSFKNRVIKILTQAKRAGPCHVCGEIGHYARECKDRKSIPVAHAVEKVTEMVASVNLGEIFMISSLLEQSVLEVGS
ncbi:unnamed protein product [Lactuca saligna]|uniref:CCHC-type domain-containing protein n=1 Tax=Lactuca saligna TaxID=75948 RepID=A0AA36EE88_LACSI|nr:unnamed protein product [Lactuca saligna]